MKHKIITICEDQTEAEITVKAMDNHLLIDDILQEIRKKLKYGHDFKTPEEALEYIRDFIYEAREP